MASKQKTRYKFGKSDKPYSWAEAKLLMLTSKTVMYRFDGEAYYGFYTCIDGFLYSVNDKGNDRSTIDARKIRAHFCTWFIADIIKVKPRIKKHISTKPKIKPMIFELDPYEIADLLNVLDNHLVESYYQPTAKIRAKLGKQFKEQSDARRKADKLKQKENK